MTTHTCVAFIDEWGNNSLDFSRKGVSTLFIIAAPTLPQEDLPQAEETLEKVRKKHFQTGPIKSSMVAGNHARRKLVLEDMMQAPFRTFALVVDKRQLVSEGLRYKGSFYKSYTGWLTGSSTLPHFPNLDLVAAPHGSDIMDGFVSYVQMQPHSQPVQRIPPLALSMARIG